MHTQKYEISLVYLATDDPEAVALLQVRLPLLLLNFFRA